MNKIWHIFRHWTSFHAYIMFVLKIKNLIHWDGHVQRASHIHTHTAHTPNRWLIWQQHFGNLNFSFYFVAIQYNWYNFTFTWSWITHKLIIYSNFMECHVPQTQFEFIFFLANFYYIVHFNSNLMRWKEK